MRLAYWLNYLTFLGGAFEGNTPPPQPQPPTPQPPKTSKKIRITVISLETHIPIEGALVMVEDKTGTPLDWGPLTGYTDHEGLWRFDTVKLGMTPVLVTVSSPGFVTWSELMPIPANDDWSYTRGLDKVPAVVYPFPDELGPLHRDGDLLKRTDGTPFDWRGLSSFLLYARFLRGEDITPQLRQARTLGRNIVRVFLEVKSPGWDGWEDFLTPELGQPLKEFIATCRTWGLRVELVALTYRHDTVNEATAKLQAVFDLCEGNPSVLIECANEPEVNSIDVVSAMAGVNTRGCLWSWGYYTPHDGTLVTAGATHGTFHSDRGRFPRSEKDGLEYRDGGVETPPIPPTHLYWASDEPMGAAAPGTPGQRSSVAADFQTAAGIARMYCGGFTLHSENGRYGRLLDPSEVACGQAVLEACQFIPPLMGRSYLRGPAPGESQGDFSILWQESDSAMGHCYAANDGNEQYVVLIQPTLPAPYFRGAAPGWRLVSQLGIMLHLTRV